MTFNAYPRHQVRFVAYRRSVKMNRALGSEIETSSLIVLEV